MLEALDMSIPDISKEEYKVKHEELVQKLIKLQQESRAKGKGLVVIMDGYPFAGKGQTITKLMCNLDARAAQVHSLNLIKVDEYIEWVERYPKCTAMNHPLKSFWDKLGERDTFTFYNDAWYCMAAYEATVYAGGKKKKAAERASLSIDSMNWTESQLAADGYTVVKFFFSLSEKALKKTAKKARKLIDNRWRINGMNKIIETNYPAYTAACDALLEGTNKPYAPWVLLNAENPRATQITFEETLVAALESALADTVSGAPEVLPAGVSKPAAPAESAFEIEENYPKFEDFRYDLVCDPQEYKIRLKELQKKLYDLQLQCWINRIPVIVMYEGWDAAGKGGNIKRVAQALDAKGYRVVTSPAPSKAELAHPFLWRYWTRLPHAGQFGLFDRSWYGRVLVERVEGFAKPDEWARAYDEINEFEQAMINWGAVVVKFWVEIDQDEQLARFKARQENPDKQWKITDEDWRNREKYDAYKEATTDMFRLTSTVSAPWTVLMSNDKRYARIQALETIIAAIEKKLAE